MRSTNNNRPYAGYSSSSSYKRGQEEESYGRSYYQPYIGHGASTQYPNDRNDDARQELRNRDENSRKRKREDEGYSDRRDDRDERRDGNRDYGYSGVNANQRTTDLANQHATDLIYKKKQVILDVIKAGKNQGSLGYRWMDDAIEILTSEELRLESKEYNIIILNFAKTSFAKNNKYRQGEFLDKWQARAITEIKNFNPQELSNSIYAFGRLEIEPSETFLKKWHDQAITRIIDFDSQNLSNSIYAFGKLGIKPDLKFLEAWKEQAIIKIGNFNSQELSNSIYAFGKLGIKPDPEFLKAWEKQAITRIKDFNPQDLSNSIYAFGLLKENPGSEFLNAWKERVITKFTDFTTQNLSNSIYAFGLLGENPGSEFLNAWEEWAIKKITNFDSQNLSNSIYAFGLLGKNPGSEFLNAWKEQAITKIKDFNPQALSNSIYAFGLLKENPGSEFLNAWKERAITKITDFTPQNLSNSIYAFGLLRIKPDPKFLEVWKEQAIIKITDFNPQDLSNSIYAFGLLRENPGSEFLKAWEERAITKITDFTSQNLSNSIYAFGLLGENPGSEFLNAWEKQAITKITDFNSQALSNSIYAFYKFGKKPDPKFLKVWYEHAIATIKDFIPLELINSVYALAELGITPEPHFMETWYKQAKTKFDEYTDIDLKRGTRALRRLKLILPQAAENKNEKNTQVSSQPTEASVPHPVPHVVTQEADRETMAQGYKKACFSITDMAAKAKGYNRARALAERDNMPRNLGAFSSYPMPSTMISHPVIQQALLLPVPVLFLQPIYPSFLIPQGYQPSPWFAPLLGMPPIAPFLPQQQLSQFFTASTDFREDAAYLMESGFLSEKEHNFFQQRIVGPSEKQLIDLSQGHLPTEQEWLLLIDLASTSRNEGQQEVSNFVGTHIIPTINKIYPGLQHNVLSKVEQEFRADAIDLLYTPTLSPEERTFFEQRIVGLPGQQVINFYKPDRRTEDLPTDGEWKLLINLANSESIQARDFLRNYIIPQINAIHPKAVKGLLGVEGEAIYQHMKGDAMQWGSRVGDLVERRVLTAGRC